MSIAALASQNNNPTYQQERRDRIMALVPQAAMGAADLYAGAVSAFPVTTGITQALPWVSGAIGVAHAVNGLRHIIPPEYGDPRTPAEIAQGFGHLVTAAGFATLAFGLGPWALPIIGIGEATRLFGACLARP